MRAEQLLKSGKQDVLQIDGQRQQAVEERRNRRQLIADAVAVGQLQPRRILEGLQCAAFDPARNQQQIELAQRVARVRTFQIVFGPE
jgi:hypothetical protein